MDTKTRTYRISKGQQYDRQGGGGDAMKTLEVANAMQHADTLARQHDPAAHLYLDLADALIVGPDARVLAAREVCIEWEIVRYRTAPPWREEA